jgi:hypothetical protein
VGIGEYAFSGCVLKEVTLPTTLKRFSAYAFYGCEVLETVYLREGTTRVENYEFSQIPKVMHIYLPSTTEYIGKQIFLDSSSAAAIQIHFNGTKAEWEAIEKSNLWNNSRKTVSVICTDETIFITNQ